jgi:hypothetical protein
MPITQLLLELMSIHREQTERNDAATTFSEFSIENGRQRNDSEIQGSKTASTTSRKYPI